MGAKIAKGHYSKGLEEDIRGEMRIWPFVTKQI